ncbi:hypothetical protein KDC22_18015 [Paenibacillus tritici]|uniref:hypothetical protein n=1 Tax=Paenibacillus tritici TaxID=1873425 RepID=UPI001BAE01C3|nr:hypothetical protein [Paenibacillus tritici]QUL52357.1 hypothetical protein KDC22_18015 [Paenibacillus tritici]
MEQNVQKLIDWLEAQKQATLVITKQELNDLDTVHFTLESVDYRNAEDVIDEYLDSALILRGSGNTLNADGELVPLPQPSYEIAVSGLKLNAVAEDKAELKTDRAVYSIALS